MKPLWKVPMTARGLGGAAATERFVLVGDRDLADLADVFHCRDAKSGAEVWTFRHPAPGKLDYGNTPRATPVIVGDLVYFFGAFGHLHCVELATGQPRWQKDLKAEFGLPSKEMPWGLCGTPLVTDGKVIVTPGAAEAALVALDGQTGAVVWKTPGGPPGYGSFIAATLGGVKQIVGHDADSLGGWDLATGKRLWRVVPKRANDYNVPTPIVWNSHLLVCTENNGSRLFRFKEGGLIDPTPIAAAKELAPDTHSPVLLGDRVFGVWQGLQCLDLKQNLTKVWTLEDEALSEYASVVAAGDRLLILTQDGELLLIDISTKAPKLIDRRKPIPDERDIYSHPAFAGTKVFLRGNDALYAFELKP